MKNQQSFITIGNTNKMSFKFSIYYLLVIILISSCTKENQSINNLLKITINNRSTFPIKNVRMCLAKNKSSTSNDTLTNELIINDISPRTSVNFNYDCRNKITESDELIYIEYYFKGVKKNWVYLGVIDSKIDDKSLEYTIFVDGSIECTSDIKIY